MFPISLRRAVFCVLAVGAAVTAQADSGVRAAIRLNAYYDIAFPVLSDPVSVQSYSRAAAAFARVGRADRANAAQIMSMIDALYGRDQAAQQRLYQAFPGKLGQKPVACPAAAAAVDTPTALAGSGAQVLLLNESHSIARTRATLAALLPALRAAGFDALALEALAMPAAAPAGSTALADAQLPARGYARDIGESGYLREPLFADAVRTALGLGFHLVAYDDAEAVTREDREKSQASRLAAFLRAHPGRRMLVVAGYDHIRKTDGWMAERLQQELPDLKLLSIDQVSGLAGCAGNPAIALAAGAPMATAVFRTAQQGYWSRDLPAVDMTVVTLAPDSPQWRSLDGARHAVAIERAYCRQKFPCLVSARYASDAADAVSADRRLRLSRRDGEAAHLYLRAGAYVVTVEQGGATRQLALTVP